MPNRRILSLWFPRLGAERVLRAEQGGISGPLAVVGEVSNTQVISALSAEAEAAGLWVGQPLRDACAMCGGLITRSRQPLAEARFLTALRRWAGKFSPWVAEAPPDGLTIDLTGCAHLFGGEDGLLPLVEQDCADMGLSVQMGVADTLGAAWALARYAGLEAGSDRNGDAIDQEARATRSRAHRRPVKGRHWTRGGAAPHSVRQPHSQVRVAAPGQAYGVLSPLPVAALRLDDNVVAQLNRLGLRRIGDLLGQPRASLGRRFGRGLVLRLDQAIGAAPEPISPARAPEHFAVRFSLPEPIGLMEDMMAAIDRLLPRLCARLEDRGMGARVLRLEAHRSDQAAEVVTLALARPTRDSARMRPLLEMKLESIDAGFGIDVLRLEAVQVERLQGVTHTGHAVATDKARARMNGGGAGNRELEDLMGRIGARMGLENITRRHPVDTHIPEKTAQVMAAAWSNPAQDWPHPRRPRPVLLWAPELVMAEELPKLPLRFRWRGRDWALARATGPERIAPEWWLDDPQWRSGVRDYWEVVTECGARLWLYFAHGGGASRGWFCQGAFA
ncbi:DNA polymerase Y family protein [Phaeobacter sp. B1627]|uniref:Y-family DNA polymerase n=1 Tax=Phaeobacter sp. B1627 TaxID=2583809 RepID=UPI0011199FED|nr:DNA polymerase Y family protein [Phaeobacter sp. B1627]TNJ41390.1 DNA polymerase Y family protein [Phaeobacter sp. B1627]